MEVYSRGSLLHAVSVFTYLADLHASTLHLALFLSLAMVSKDTGCVACSNRVLG